MYIKKILGVIGIILTCIKPIWIVVISSMTYNRWYTCGALCAFIICDIMDGVWYRQSGLCISFFDRYRRHIDIIGDKIVAWYCIYHFSVYLYFPIVFLIVIKLRDVIVGKIVLKERLKTNMFFRYSMMFLAASAATWIVFLDYNRTIGYMSSGCFVFLFLLASVHGIIEGRFQAGGCQNTSTFHITLRATMRMFILSSIIVGVFISLVAFTIFQYYNMTYTSTFIYLASILAVVIVVGATSGFLVYYM